jgi:hypothetical protein
MGEAGGRKHIVGATIATDPFASFPMPLPPREVSMTNKRSMSVMSSFDDFGDRFPYNERPLTDDEKFDLDYGEDFDDVSTKDAVAGAIFREEKPNDETRGLLSNSNSDSGEGNYNYSSTANDMV